MNAKSRSWVKHAVLVLVALVGLSFSLAAAAEDGDECADAGRMARGPPHAPAFQVRPSA